MRARDGGMETSGGDSSDMRSVMKEGTKIEDEPQPSLHGQREQQLLHFVVLFSVSLLQTHKGQLFHFKKFPMSTVSKYASYNNGCYNVSDLHT